MKQPPPISAILHAVSRPETCSTPVQQKSGVCGVHKFTFNIEDEAALVGVKRESPWLTMREKLFGIGTGRVAIRPVPMNLELNRQTAARRVTETRGASNSGPVMPHPFGKPANAASRPALTLAQTPALPRAPFQVEYKDRLIVAYPLEDGSWTASHLPLGSNPSRDFTAQNRHRFKARILAISSAEIEIDELEKTNGAHSA